MMEKIIKSLLKKRNTPAIMKNRQSELQSLVDVHGILNVSLATELKESSLKQYLREKHPRISAEVLAQANYVFSSEEYKKAQLALDNLA